MTVIKNIVGREIIDSRGNPTLEVELTTSTGTRKYASVPSGASVGADEAIEMRDGDAGRYNGLGLQKAIKILNYTVTPAVIEQRFSSLRQFDDKLLDVDGTGNKARIGANTSLALSIAFARCLSAERNLELFQIIQEEYGAQCNNYAPIPMLNIINGGKHANNKLALQEFMVMPVMDDGATISDRIRISCEFFSELRRYIQKCGYSTSVGDEGGFTPPFSSPGETLDIISNLISQSKYESCFKIAIDAAASTFFDEISGLYSPDQEKDSMTSSEMVKFYGNLIDTYPIVSIEDPMSESDVNGWAEITRSLGDKVMIVGDDLFVTNTKNLQHGIDNGLANAILIKPNQIGTLSETINAVKMARENNYEVIVSHRSGETEDTSLSHFAVGVSAKYFKAGAPCRSERVAKYNELIRIFGR